MFGGQAKGVLLLIFVITLADATGRPPTRFIEPSDDGDPAATFLPDDPLFPKLRARARVVLNPTWTNLN